MRYFLELSYHGKNYYGWQIQPDVISVQEKITTALSTILREEITIVGAGRTDSGVHASQMYAHFDVDKDLDNNFTYKLNAILPDDIVIYRTIKVADEAHARFDAISRSYEYKIWMGRNPFLLNTTWQLNYKSLNIEAMNTAAKLLYEYEDFECFSKVKTDVHTFNCEVTNAVWKLEGEELTFYISANRFLRNMVRAIVGTLLDIGLGKKSVEDFRMIIESKKRSKAGVSVPAKGLFLTKVEYDYI
ncbi:tRNA pseudouridine(38-40) synthase TruA [Tenacibaculum sp. SZ-18]|uniref:tRNA pseudouridine(38-40) synthase TruA n=1 Tax=Tenacibaculum sp. SZ-18 TaxID=754423 RepID=UPI000C2D219C|nr:tRNA pseudouridine(38-40) synthase TruA [Tenacibaculum sp. SZ-18]AUC16131.1 tRNA pseudouridine(38-40) synthase TruA [Tenacibaculum sp. SZ-18]